MLNFISKQTKKYTDYSKRYNDFERAAFPDRAKNRSEFWDGFFDKLKNALGTYEYDEILNSTLPDFL